MGELIERRIVQSRIYRDPNPEPIPEFDYDYSYPKTVYAAVMKTMDDNSPSLEDELIAIYRLINAKQDKVSAGVPGQVMTYTGVEGQIGAMEVVKRINSDAAQRSNQRLASEMAIGTELDLKTSKAEFREHVYDATMHITDVERTRWNGMAPMSSLQAHMQNANVHVTNAERTRWNAKANQEDVDEHIYNMNNPHNVSAHQVGTYTRPEIDEMFKQIRESFFNYKNIYWDDRDYTAKLVDYQAVNWNPNFVLKFGESLPDVEDPNMMYFAVIPATDYETAESQDVIIWVKRPGLAWQEVGFQTMEIGDMVIRFPDTTMYVWVEGRFMMLFSEAAEIAVDEQGQMWRPSINEEGLLTWTMSKEKTPPEPMVIKGKDGYTPVKGVDYDDGKDGEGVAIGGAAGDLLVKLSDENFDTTWKSFMDILNDLVIAGITFPEGLVQWKAIAGRPEWYDELGDNADGFITQRAATRQFEIVANNISQIQEQLIVLNKLKDDFYDHINDFNNPHRVTPGIIGAPTLAQFMEHVQNYDNPHQVSADQLGLGNVENTSDLDKPISNATQEALDELQKKIETIQEGVDGLNYMTNVIWDGKKVTLTFIFRDNSTLDVHIPITEIFNSIYYDKVEKELVIVMPDGTENRIDISDLIVVYFGSISDNIQVVIEDDNVIKATIIPGTVGELEIAVSVHLRGSPTTTTQPVNDRSTRIATTEFVKAGVIDNLISYETDRPLSANMGRILNERKADIEDVIQIINDMEGIEVIDSLDSTDPLAALSANMGRYLDLTKAPRVHTSPSGSTFGRATISVFGHAKASDTDPLMDGTVSRGTDDGEYARGDHRHPTDITRAPIHWPDIEHGQYKMTGEPKADTPPDDSNDERIVTTEWIRRNAVGVFFGRCKTAVTDNTKVVALESTFAEKPVLTLQKGVVVNVIFSNNGATPAGDLFDNKTVTRVMYLNVQSTGAKPVKYGNMNIVSEMIKANHMYVFAYDGANWQLVNPSGIHTLPDDDYSNSFVSSEWVRRNAVGVSFGKCTTPTATTTKVVALESTFMDTPVLILQKGSTVSVTFTNDAIAANADTASNNNDSRVINMNVQSTGAKPIKYGGKNIKSEMIRAGYTYLFTFDGTNWNLENPTGIHTLPDSDNSNSLVSSEWVRRNAVGVNWGTCATGSAVAAKVVTLKSTYMDPVVFIRQIGSTVSVKFDNMDWSGDTDTTMDVQSTGAKPIRFGGRKLVNGMIGAGHEHIFTFDGNYWQLHNPVPGTGYGTIKLGPTSNTVKTILNQNAGFTGYTLQGDGTTDDSGYVNYVQFGIDVDTLANDIQVDVSTAAGAFAAAMGDGTTIDLSNPKVVQTNEGSCVVQFKMGTAYPSNSPCSLVYKTSEAYIDVTEAN